MGRLEELDLSSSLPKKEAKSGCARSNGGCSALRLRLAGLEGATHRTTGVRVFEGWDASGKGGAIKRLVQQLDPRHVRVRSFSPRPRTSSGTTGCGGSGRRCRAGDMPIFDRSWYGRVLVERVEGFCTEAEAWQRAYREIDVEHRRSPARRRASSRQVLAANLRGGTLARFKERRTIPYKQWKITDEDWRNREKWDQYRGRRGDALPHEHAHAPWTIVEADCEAVRTMAGRAVGQPGDRDGHRRRTDRVTLAKDGKDPSPSASAVPDESVTTTRNSAPLSTQNAMIRRRCPPGAMGLGEDVVALLWISGRRSCTACRCR